jgi:methylmalonyl-CoA mutase C-terminal domain/subunit
MQRKIRVLVGKPGLDGHDRGAKVVAAALRDAGMEVIYTGLHQSPQQIVEAATQEDVDVIALSVLSGAHMTLFPEVRRLLEQRGLGDRLLTGGGIIPAEDMEALAKLGVGRLFGPGSSTQDIVAYIREWFVRRHGDTALDPAPPVPAQTDLFETPAPAEPELAGAVPSPLRTTGRLATKRMADRAEKLARLKAEAAHHRPGAQRTARGGARPRATAKRTVKPKATKSAARTRKAVKPKAVRRTAQPKQAVKPRVGARTAQQRTAGQGAAKRRPPAKRR